MGKKYQTLFFSLIIYLIFKYSVYGNHNRIDNENKHDSEEDIVLISSEEYIHIHKIYECVCAINF